VSGTFELLPIVLLVRSKCKAGGNVTPDDEVPAALGTATAGVAGVAGEAGVCGAGAVPVGLVLGNGIVANRSTECTAGDVAGDDVIVLKSPTVVP
jgi:hypothetical protein